MAGFTSRSVSLLALLGVLLACKALEKKNEATPAASAAPAATATATATASAAAAAGGKQKTDLSGPKDAKGVDLDKLLGTKADGWSLPPTAKLKEDQTPAEVGKLLPGGEKIDEYGFSEIKPTNVKGVAMYKLSYQDSNGKKGLKFISILFDPAMTDEPFWNALVDHLQKKLAVDMTDHGDHHVQWIGPGFLSWSLSKGITHEGYELQTAVGK
jgi:hypothetical protein